MTLRLKTAQLAIASLGIIAFAASACPQSAPPTNPERAELAATSPLPLASVEVSTAGTATGAAGESGRESGATRRQRGLEKFKAEPVDQPWATQMTKDLETVLDAHGVKRLSIECRRSTCLVHVEEREEEVRKLRKLRTDDVRAADRDLRRKGHRGGLSGRSGEQLDGGATIAVYWFSFVR